MLKKPMIILSIVFLLFFSMFSGCLFFKTTTFNLLSSSLEDAEGFPSLQMMFNISDIATLRIYGPSSQLLSSELFYRGMHTAYLRLGSFHTDPVPGIYQFVVVDEKNKSIFTKDFSFSGSDLSISQIHASWSKENQWENQYSLVELNFSVINQGDLIVYPSMVDVAIAGKNASASPIPQGLLPGQQGMINCFIDLEGILPDTQRLEVSLKNINNEVIATTSCNVIPQENISIITYSWDFEGRKKIELPDPDYLYSYYKGLPRLVLTDYAAYVFDQYDRDYFGIVRDTFLDLLDTVTSDVDRVNMVGSFVQNLPYAEDNASDPTCEYPRYPIEMLVDQKGDCEDKAILTAAILDTLGYNVSLLRLPNHMAVGVHLSKPVPIYTYNIKEYYFLETTRPHWMLGQVPPEYNGISNVTVYPLSLRPILIHRWENATRYTVEEKIDYVQVKILVENVGGETADEIEVTGAFFLDVYGYNQEAVWIPTLRAGDKTQVTLKVTVPKQVSTILITQLLYENQVVDERESSSTFS